MSPTGETLGHGEAAAAQEGLARKAWAVLPLWPLMSAAYLSIDWQGMELSQMAGVARPAYMWPSAIAVSVVAGLALSALVVLGCRAVARKGPPPNAPGHWILIAGGLSFLVLRVTGLLYMGYVSGAAQIFLLDGITRIAVAAIWVWGAVQARRAPLWALLCATQAAIYLAGEIVGHRPGSAATALFAPPLWRLSGLLFAGSVVNDILSRRWFDWLHWMGAAFFVGWWCVQLVQWWLPAVRVQLLL
jgi:hypothetical protein